MPEPSGTSPILPPAGDADKAGKYLDKLTALITADKLKINHTDLAKLDPSNLQDHYFCDLKDYRVEISHNKHPQSGQDSYVILFTNLQQIREGCSEKIILAYMYLDPAQYSKFKAIADGQIMREKKRIEEARLDQVMEPIDQALDELISNETDEKLLSPPAYT